MLEEPKNSGTSIEDPNAIFNGIFEAPKSPTPKYNDTPRPVSPPHQSETADNVRFRVKTKTVFICTFEDCGKELGRKTELYRHHRSAHEQERPFKCHDTACYRSVRGFPRKDKRDDHVRKVHKASSSRNSTGGPV
jgi:hypothetical protein